jgi:hypothetical protein
MYEESGPFTYKDFDYALKWAANRKQSPHVAFITTRPWRTEELVEVSEARQAAGTVARAVSALARSVAYNTQDAEYPYHDDEEDLVDAIAHLLVGEAAQPEEGSFPWVLQQIRAGCKVMRATRSQRWYVYDKNSTPLGPPLAMTVVAPLRTTPGVFCVDGRVFEWRAPAITGADQLMERVGKQDFFVRLGTAGANVLETEVQWVESLDQGRVVRLHCTNGMTVDIPRTQFSLLDMRPAL